MAHITYTITQSSEDIAYTVTPDGEEITYIIDDGVGPAGPAGPSNITTATQTDITGILKGDGANVGAAVADTDYQSVPAEGAFADGDKTKLDGIEAGADVTDAANVDAAGAVMESDYSPAHSVLAQQSGTGSPSAVSLGTNSLLGRASGAGTSIQGLTAAQARTLLNVEDGATADQTDAEILAAVESESGRDMSVDGAKLDGIEAGATADQTASEILTAIKTVDGTGSGLDADLLDGQDSTAFATSAQGALADSAVQPGDDLDVIGGVTITAPATAGQYLRYDGTSEFRNSAIGALDLPDLSSTYATVSHSHTAGDLDFAGSTEIGADLDDADEILVSDGGGNTTRRKSLVSRIWTYIKAKIESVGLASLDITGNLTVDTNTLQVNATTNEVTIAQDLYSQAPMLIVNGFSSFDGGLGVFAVNSGTWNGSTITGNQDFSGQVELTGQAASTDDSAMTRSLVPPESTEANFIPVYFSDTATTSGTVGTNLSRFAQCYVRLTTGSSSGNYALYSTGDAYLTPLGISGSGSNMRFGDASWTAIFTTYSIHRNNMESYVLFGVSSTEQDLAASAGFGVKFIRNGSNLEVYIISNDGTTLDSSTAYSLGVDYTRVYTFMLVAADGQYALYLKYHANSGTEEGRWIEIATLTDSGLPNNSSGPHVNVVSKATGTPDGNSLFAVRSLKIARQEIIPN